jgi:hypothetical protein
LKQEKNETVLVPIEQTINLRTQQNPLVNLNKPENSSGTNNTDTAHKASDCQNYYYLDKAEKSNSTNNTGTLHKLNNSQNSKNPNNNHYKSRGTNYIYNLENRYNDNSAIRASH